MMRLWGARGQETKPNASGFPFKSIKMDYPQQDDNTDNNSEIDTDDEGYFSPLDSPMGDGRRRSSSGASINGFFPPAPPTLIATRVFSDTPTEIVRPQLNPRRAVSEPTRPLPNQAFHQAIGAALNRNNSNITTEVLL
jgi:hypothetical protein